MDAERYSARQFGAQHVVERLHNGLIRPIDGNGFQHKAHRGVIHEQTGFLVVITVRQQTAELREAHFAQNFIGLCGFVRQFQCCDEGVNRLSDGLKWVIHMNSLVEK
ncbi:Uncharacterised protein [Shigella sonnei]|nr:Uncharacterised protein [Shigella sonnei]